MRPSVAVPDDSKLTNSQADISAAAPSGKLRLNNKQIPGVLKVSPGIQVLTLPWEGGERETRFFASANFLLASRCLTSIPRFPVCNALSVST
jgi:hypothetical protein